MAFPNFEKISAEKQQRIVNAGFVAFGKNGYEKTSIGEVVELCGISKASLFHYFGNKHDFYLYLYDFACDRIIEHACEGSPDFFECLILSNKAKLQVMQSYNGLYDFLLGVITENDLDLQNELFRRNQQAVGTSLQLLFKNVKWDKLKPEVTPDIAIELTSYVSSGLVRAHAHEAPEQIDAHLKLMFDLLRTALYKPEFV